MDSRLKFKSIFISVIVILILVTGVAGYNIYDYAMKLNKAQAESEQADASETGDNALPPGSFTNSSGLKPENPNVDYKAFERDETFFDKELSAYDQMMETRGKKLSLAATSVDKDLRIKIYNDLDKLVEIDDLYVLVDGEPYKDLDQDGIVYVPDLKAGMHEVVIQPMDDYQVPKSPLQVKVKANIEYKPIEDISLLIKTEADIDANLEDTEIFDSEDEDSSMMTGKWSSTGNEEFGIDVSKWNKHIDWQLVRNEGVQFAIIRCGYRGSKTGALVEDPYFLENLTNAKQAGIKVGLYFFTQAVNEIEAVEEASMVLELNKGMLDYPIFIDTEGAGGNGRADGLDMSTRTKVCQAFCETITNAGYDAGIYASRNWFNNKLYTSEMEDDYCIWLAEYRKEPQYSRKYNMWQYTSSGELNGIQGRVDFNISYPRNKVDENIEKEEENGQD